MSIAKTKNPGFSVAFAVASLGAVMLGNASCVRDTDCGICDPDKLILESVSGLNYASKKIHVLNPKCEGDSCPKPIKKGSYFVEEVVPCEKDENTLEFIQTNVIDAGLADADDQEAIDAYIQEFCQISPLVVRFGIEFVFNNLLDPTTVELIRKRPDQPKLFEVYSWKPNILDIIGPTTRYNGDFTKGAAEVPDVITRLINLSCIDNLRDEGQDYSDADYKVAQDNICNKARDVGGDLVPWKMRVGTDDSRLQSYRGVTTAGGNSCDSPQDGADTCCSDCDFVLSTAIAKYGLMPDGATPRTPETALECDASNMTSDAFTDCREFIVSADRTLEEQRYDYWWDCPPGGGCDPVEGARVPKYDRIRETHPDDRPAWPGFEDLTSKCTTDSECFVPNKPSIHELPGTVCIGVNAEGNACREELDMTGTCNEGRCRAQWNVGCAADGFTTGSTQGLCVDRRFSNAGAAACYVSTGDDEFQGQCDPEGQSCNDYNPGQRLANCNGDANDTVFGAAECCQEALGRGDDLNETEPDFQCDPYFQSLIAPIERYDRNESLPDQTRSCVCHPIDEMGDKELELCGRTVVDVCYDGDKFLDERLGEYAVKFIARPGGVVYDPAIKGIEWRPADIGGIPRAKIEVCAEDRGLIGALNRHDGWRANDAFGNGVESYEDFDRAMCSGQDYTVKFAVPGNDADQFIVDKVGNSMEGHSEYTFTTTDFHVVPGSGFPTDNLRIGACDSFSVRFSNKYDMSPENQKKLEIYLLDPGEDLDDPSDDIITNTPANAGCGGIVPIAGGQNCVETKAELDLDGDGRYDPCLSPCLTIDIAAQAGGEIKAQINPTEFGPILKVDSRYRLSVFGLDNLGEMSDDAAYFDAFWDACGMPLVQRDAAAYFYDFTIDTPKCKEDPDRDTIQLSCDNAKDNFNPDQADLDRDGVGDVIDLCPTVASKNNSADSDKDGVGNDCDSCRQTTTQYNMRDAGVSVMDFMFVRNIPWQVDTDEDGIGDVCDNCVQVPNCESFGTDNPYEVGTAIAYDDRSRCQNDDDENLIGTACEGDEAAGAAGPVGVGAMDDFDQDGIANSVDACPRQPVPLPVACTMGGDECGANADCEGTVCDHDDFDNDGVGDICDTCPFTGNPSQTMDGAAQEEDEDGDFVGQICETNAQCATRADPRPFAFYQVSADGQCCTVALVEDGMGNLVNAATGQPLVDPDGLPISVGCVEGDDAEMRTCRKLPSDVASAPGILAVPDGCDEALATAGITAAENTRLTVDEAGGTLDALWQNFCFLPQTDQDFDSFGEPCDLCPFQFDPDNTSFVDPNGRAWPKAGKYCNGDYAPDALCAAQEDTEGESGGSGSESGTGGGTMGTGGTGVGTGGTVDG